MQRAFIPIALVSALGACVASNGDEGIFITKNVAPGAMCSFTASAAEAFVPHGTLSVHSPGAYRFHPQMLSRITATSTEIDQRTVIVSGARVDISFADKNLFSATELARLNAEGTTHFQSLFSAPLTPNGGIADGSFDLIPRRLVDEIVAKNPAILTGSPTFATELVAKIVVFGDLSGSEVTSQEFQYPVTVCNNCVVNVVGTCPLKLGTILANVGNSCNIYQDGTVDCCGAPGGAPTCPAMIGTM